MPLPLTDDESIRRLRDFVEQLRILLDQLTNYYGSLIPGRHQESMQAAWMSVQPKFAELDQVLTTPFKGARADSRMADLKRMGLTGDELRFKLSIFNHARDELRDRLRHSEERPGLLKRGWRTLGKLLKQTLSAADVILGSLASALPLSPAEAIKEFKEAAESGLELGLGVAESSEPDEDDPYAR